MDETLVATFGALIGTLIGGLLTLRVARDDRREARRARLERDVVERSNRLEDLLIAACIEFMDAGRKLRFLARRMTVADRLYQRPPVRDEEQIEIREVMHPARYRIHILAPQAVRASVDAYHDAVMEFYSTARESPNNPALSALGRRAHDAQDDLEGVLCAELGVAERTPWHRKSVAEREAESSSDVASGRPWRRLFRRSTSRRGTR